MPAPARKRSATLARPASESKPILAAVLALVGLFMLVAMITHSSNDRSWLGTQDTTVPVTDNYCGELGASIAVALFNLFGYAGFLIPFFVLAAAWFALNQRAHTLWPFKVTLMVLCVILFAPILTLWLGTSPDATAAFDPKGPGGVLGNILFLDPRLPLRLLPARRPRRRPQGHAFFVDRRDARRLRRLERRT